MKKIQWKDLIFKPLNGGIQAKGFFNNCYGYSLIKGPYSYGGDKGLYELAVLQGNEKKSLLCYSTEITNDVIGYLTQKDAIKIINKIQLLTTLIK